MLFIFFQLVEIQIVSFKQKIHLELSAFIIMIVNVKTQIKKCSVVGMVGLL